MYIDYNNNICFSKELRCNKCKKKQISTKVFVAEDHLGLAIKPHNL